MTTGLQQLLTAISTGSILDRRRHWYVLRIFGFYRLILAIVLLGLFFASDRTPLVGAQNPQLFLRTVTFYLAIALIALMFSYWRRPALAIQAHLHTLADLIVLGLLIHASGGSSENLGVLLVIAVAAAGVLLPLSSTLLAATLAIGIMLFGLANQAWWTFRANAGNLPLDVNTISDFIGYFLHTANIGYLGVLTIALLIAGFTTFGLAERARRGERLARQRSQELVEQMQLNQTIVQHLQSGIIVVDKLARVRLINDMARGLLDYHGHGQDTPLHDVSMALSQRLATWLGSGLHSAKPFRAAAHLPDVTPTFSTLQSGDGQTADTLIFLEDSEQAAHHLQQIKLAALGRLTAGIAHEIRNPLSSISHAAQLLVESTSVVSGDKRLGQIIHDNAKRANRIIASVLDLERRDKVKPEDFLLNPWLEEFRQEFLRGHGSLTPRLDIDVQPPDLAVRFDPVHLHQVLWNLCMNACIHGTPEGETPQIRLVAHVDKARAKPLLDIIDSGPGVSETASKRLFEPFFTTKPQGAGLGLYISREIVEANRGQLQYLRADQGGSCFRITFANASKEYKGTPWTQATH